MLDILRITPDNGTCLEAEPAVAVNVCKHKLRIVRAMRNQICIAELAHKLDTTRSFPHKVCWQYPAVKCFVSLEDATGCSKVLVHCYIDD